MKNYCIDCNCVTNQSTIAMEEFNFPREIFSKEDNGLHKKSLWVIILSEYFLLKCDKCERPSLQITEFCINDNKKTEIVYPNRILVTHPEWMRDTPVEYYEIINEIHRSLNNECFILAAIGIRTLIDILLVELVGDVGGFEQKLKKTKNANILNNAEFDMLSVLVDAGGAAAHRGYKPDEKTIIELYTTAMHFVNVGIRTKKVGELKGKIPKRQKD